MFEMSEIFDFGREFKLLILASILLLVLSLLIILITFFYQMIKMNRIKRQREVEDELDEWLAEVLSSEDNQLEVPVNLAVYFKDPLYHGYITERLILVKKNISGHSLLKIIEIYEISGLKEGSVKKISNSSWQLKALGIYELSMMMQKDMVKEISRYTHSENDFVRVEAQTAMISFEGFSGLQFLNDLTQPLTEWHQLKLTEQLTSLNTENIIGLENWLRSPNHHVVIFALKLAANFQQLHVHDAAANCLKHENEKVRAEAVHTLTRVSNSFTANYLVKQYQFESTMNKKNILRSLSLIAGEEQQSFLSAELANADDDLKLLSACAIINTYAEGERILKEKALSQHEPYQQIYLHAKREVRE